MNNSPTHSGPLIGSHQSQRLQLSLAIESSTRYASLALANNGATIRYLPLDRQSRTAATISVALDQLLAEVRAAGQAIDYVAVTDGPGSFTGLRIGVTAAKTLAYALGCKLVAVDSLATMAWQLWPQYPEASRVMLALNAYRGQLFTASWTREAWETALATGNFATQSEVKLADQWAVDISLANVSSAIAAESAVAQKFADNGVQIIEPTAIATAALGDLVAKAGNFVSPMGLLPRYLRDSAAEEKLG